MTTGLQYDINKNHVAGAQYRFAKNDFKNTPSFDNYDLYADDVLMEKTNIEGLNFSDQTIHQLNAFYQGTFSDKLNLYGIVSFGLA